MKINKYKFELQQARSGLNLTQVAAQCDMSRQNMSRILRKGVCNPATLGKIARALGVDPEEIVDNE